MMDIVDIVASIITEDVNNFNDYFAAVAIPEHKRGRWLLGLSTADDGRRNRWCFPGGRLKPGETPEKAAVRECFEETGVKSQPIRKAFSRSDKKGVAFVYCHILGLHPQLKPNSEFTTLGLFTHKQMKSLKLYENVLELINRCY